MILATVNNKGGVGKTSLTINMGHALANKGKKVLIIDADPQANATSILLPNTEPENSLYELYSGGIDVASCIYATPYERMDILPTVEATASLEPKLYENLQESYLIIKNKVRGYALKNYDFVIVDCPPTMGLWVMMALSASDAVICPVLAGSRFALKGLTATYDAITALSQTVNTDLKFLRTLINSVDMRESVTKLTVDHIKRHFEGKCFDTLIPRSTVIQQSEMKLLTVIRHAPESTASKRFRLLADEILALV